MFGSFPPQEFLSRKPEGDDREMVARRRQTDRGGQTRWCCLVQGVGRGPHLPLSERLGEECWLFGVLTEGPTGAPRNSFSRDESPLPWRREQMAGEAWAGASTVRCLIFKKKQTSVKFPTHFSYSHAQGRLDGRTLPCDPRGLVPSADLDFRDLGG